MTAKDGRYPLRSSSKWSFTAPVLTLSDVDPSQVCLVSVANLLTPSISLCRQLASFRILSIAPCPVRCVRAEVVLIPSEGTAASRRARRVGVSLPTASGFTLFGAAGNRGKTELAKHCTEIKLTPQGNSYRLSGGWGPGGRTFGWCRGPGSHRSLLRILPSNSGLSDSWSGGGY